MSFKYFWPLRHSSVCRMLSEFMMFVTVLVLFIFGWSRCNSHEFWTTLYSMCWPIKNGRLTNSMVDCLNTSKRVICLPPGLMWVIVAALTKFAWPTKRISNGIVDGVCPESLVLWQHNNRNCWVWLAGVPAIHRQPHVTYLMNGGASTFFSRRFLSSKSLGFGGRLTVLDIASTSANYSEYMIRDGSSNSTRLDITYG